MEIQNSLENRNQDRDTYCSCFNGKMKTGFILAHGLVFFSIYASAGSQKQSSKAPRKRCDKYNNEYFTDGFGCRKCDKCLVGQGKNYEERVPYNPVNGATECLQCHDCSDGYFNNKRRHKCKPCKTCSKPGQTILRNCTSKSNTVCGKMIPDMIDVTSVADTNPNSSEWKAGSGNDVITEVNKPKVISGISSEVVAGLTVSIMGIVLMALLVIFLIYRHYRRKSIASAPAEDLYDNSCHLRENIAQVASSDESMPLLVADNKSNQLIVKAPGSFKKVPQRMFSFPLGVDESRAYEQDVQMDAAENLADSYQNVASKQMTLKRQERARQRSDTDSKPVLLRYNSLPVGLQTIKKSDSPILTQNPVLERPGELVTGKATSNIVVDEQGLFCSKSQIGTGENAAVDCVGQKRKTCLDYATGTMGPAEMLLVARKTAPKGQFKNIGRILGVEDCDIETIAEDHRDHVVEQAYQVYMKWQQANGIMATRSMFMRALKKSGRADVIADITQKGLSEGLV